jgi:hypothetical protein
MSTRNSIYKGHVQIYLQGQNALIPVDATRDDQITYFVGSEQSELLIRDYRQKSVRAAQQALSGSNIEQFADVFNEPAYTEIFAPNETAELETVEVNLYPTAEFGDFPFLWLGVIDNLRMPTFDTDWEILRSICPTRIAFAAMVNSTNFVEDEPIDVNVNEAAYSFK